MELTLMCNGHEEKARAEIYNYASNGNLAIMIYTSSVLGWEPFGKLTVNTDYCLPKDYALVDVNDKETFIKLVRRYRLAIPTGRQIPSGYVLYPEYKFDSQALQMLDPEGYAKYVQMIAQRDEDDD